jgi:hypothetical protein
MRVPGRRPLSRLALAAVSLAAELVARVALGDAFVPPRPARRAT